MLDTSVEPRQLEVDRQVDLAVRLVNAGIGPCTDLVFRLQLPVQVRLLRGNTLIRRTQLDAGTSASCVLRVRPRQVGIWRLTSPNFSYLDPQGRFHDVDDWSLDLQVVPAAPAPAPEPATSSGAAAAPTGRRGVFICYRREDTAAVAGRLSDHLGRRYGEDRVFIDVDSIEYGVDFHEPIAAAIQSCAVLLAVIGDGWTAAGDEQGRRRLDDPDDPVRREIEAALARGVRVIPVTVDTPMPPARDLPGGLASLAGRQAFPFRRDQFKRDVALLLEVLDPLILNGR